MKIYMKLYTIHKQFFTLTVTFILLMIIKFVEINDFMIILSVSLYERYKILEFYQPNGCVKMSTDGRR